MTNHLNPIRIFYRNYARDKNVITIKTSNNQPILVPHELLGFTHPTGDYFIEQTRKGVSGSHSFHVLTDKNGFRLASMNEPENKDWKIWVFGCSFSWGFGVDNMYAYPWLIQRLFPNVAVKNFSVCGYGTVHYLVQLKKNLKNGFTGQERTVALFSYIPFHGTRNVANPSRMREFTVRGIAKTEHLFHWQSEPSDDVFLQRRRFTNDWLKSSDFPREELSKVTINLFRQIYGICRDALIHPAIVAMHNEDTPDEVLSECQKTGFEIIDCRIDWNYPGFNNFPIDGHPSPTLHRLYCQRISAHLKRIIK